MRAGNAITPLISAAEVYPALERMILEARDTVHLGFRILDPAMPLVSDEAKAEGLEDWTDLLRHAASRGVRVRALLSDFDPIMAADLHRLTWRTYERLREAARAVPEGAGSIEMIAGLHEARMGRVLRTLFWPVVWRRLSGLAEALKGEVRHTISRPPHELTRAMREEETLSLRELPGVWRIVSRLFDLTPDEWAERLERSAEKGRLQRLRAPLWPPAKLWPVTHHQKIAVVDGARMIVGGLDVNARRWDDRTHDRPAEDAWHDISLHVAGPVVADAERHFRDMWNVEAPRFGETLEALAPLIGPDETRAAPREIEGDAPAVASIEADKTVSAQFLRTVSVARGGPFAFAPRSLRRDLEAGHHAVIEAAETVLYIETQFFRLRGLARAIAARAEARPGLKVIVLIPNAPEDVAWDDNDGPDATHGEFLQVRALNLLKRRLKDRLGLYTLIQRGRAEDEDGRARAHGAGIVYLHSKVMIADDRTALVSSANLNGRSFRWDTEAGVLWEDGGTGSVADLRRSLWSGHMPGMPDDDWPLDAAFETWARRAADNRARPQAERSDFVAPYQIGRARRFAKRSLFIPDDMI